MFAGDRRVWKAAAIAAVPFLALIAFYCLRPRDYYTGTNSVEAYGYIVETAPGEPVCVPGLRIPAGTARIRLQLLSGARTRPALHMALHLGGSQARAIDSALAPIVVPSNRVSAAVFTIPRLPSHPSEPLASLCLTASDVSRIGAILHRASLFRPSPVGPWLYVLILLIVLPGLALASVRCLALTALAGGGSVRRTVAWLFAIAALNFACWALITPPFQAPDEVDHFAYTQSLVQRGEAPSRNLDSPLPRWSSAETLALEDTSFFNDHQVGDTRPPWTSRQQVHYSAKVAASHPSSSDGGGNETAATHGAIYYAALAPAYLLASSSPFSQLTLMRLTSALIGALTVVFAFLLARELAPGRPWLGVLAALLVAYQPMYGFISGAVNNDVGVNAGAAALELLLIMMLRRGVTLRLGLLTGGLLIALPIVKGTAYSLYPVVGIALLATLYRHHRRAGIPGWAALAAAALVVRELSVHIAHIFHPAAGPANLAATQSAGKGRLKDLELLLGPEQRRKCGS